jgi:hypothetical protein
VLLVGVGARITTDELVAAVDWVEAVVDDEDEDA